MYIMIFISSSKTVAENVILKRLFTLGLGQVLRGNGGGDSVVFESVISHIVAFCRRDGFKSLSWQALPQTGKFYHHYHLDCYRGNGSCIFGMPGVFSTWKGKEGGHVR